MSTTTKLTDAHLVILSHAAQRPDHRVLPMPPNLQANGGAVRQAVKALLKRGLIAEHLGASSDEEWRRDENDAALTVVITPAGLAAIGVETDDDLPERSALDEATGGGQDHASVAEMPTASAAPGETAGVSGTPGGKGAAITALLKRECGATLAELTTVTGWQAHSVRGFLSGTLKKKLGYAVASERGEDGVRRYRIAA